MTNQQQNRQGQKGITLLSVIVATTVLLLVALAVTTLLAQFFHSARDSEPKSIGQTAVSNVQTDLNAITMYDASVLTKLGAGQTLTMAAPATGNYPPSDTQATKVLIQQVNGAGTAVTLNVNYAVPGGSGTAPTLTGNSTLSVFQKAPNGCAPILVGKPNTGC